VAVPGGAIARIAPDIAETEATRTIDVRGRTVVPGLIDLHAHVFEGINRTGVNPDLGGVYSGVTTIVDAGSAGAATFGIPPSCPTARPEVMPFRTSARPGSPRCRHHRGEQRSTSRHGAGRPGEQGPDPRDQGAHGVARARDHGHGDAEAGQAGRQGERRQADGAHRRHREALRSQGDPLAAPILEKGDILTHYFTANPGVLDGNGKLVPEAREAPTAGCGSTPPTGA
jgi:dihydroorotase